MLNQTSFQAATRAAACIVWLGVLVLPAAAQTQQRILPIAPPTQPKLVPLPTTNLTPELLHLIELEARFSADVAKGGGKAFASWFAEDGVTLSNGQPAVLGQRAIADSAQWDPKNYQLTWMPEGAQLSSAGDMGFTWGHYEATTRNASTSQSSVLGGRYITIWKKVANGEWKVALDASANDVPVPAPPVPPNLPVIK